MLETLRSIDHRRYLFGVKRSTEANSWSWQKVFPFWKPKVWRKAVKHFMCPWDFTDWGNRKERDGCFYVPFLSFFFPFFPSFFFFCLFLSFFLPLSFVPVIIAVRSTTHQTTDLPVHFHTAQQELALLLSHTVPSDCKWHAFIPLHVVWSCH